MDYELIKKLKAAGFPQEGEGKWLLHKGQNCGITTLSQLFPEMSYIPTLEDLIKALGDDFRRLEDQSRGNEISFVAGSAYTFGQDITPSDALAELWLELNEQKRP